MRVSPISFKRAIKTNVPIAVVEAAIKESKTDFPSRPRFKNFMNNIFNRENELDILYIFQADKNETYIFTKEAAVSANKYCEEQYVPKQHLINRARDIYEMYGDMYGEGNPELNIKYTSSKKDGISIQKATYKKSLNNGFETIKETIEYKKN